MLNWKKERCSESPHTGNWLCGIFLESNDPLKMCLLLPILFLYTSVHHMFSMFVVAFSPLYTPNNESFAEMYLKTKVQTAEWKPSETLAPLKLISLGKFHKNSPEKKTHRKMLNLFDFVFLRFTFFRLQSMAVYMRILVGIFILAAFKLMMCRYECRKKLNFSLFWWYLNFPRIQLNTWSAIVQILKGKNVESDTFDVFFNTIKLCSNIAFVWH